MPLSCQSSTFYSLYIVFLNDFSHFCFVLTCFNCLPFGLLLWSIVLQNVVESYLGSAWSLFFQPCHLLDNLVFSIWMKNRKRSKGEINRFLSDFCQVIPKTDYQSTKKLSSKICCFLVIPMYIGFTIIFVFAISVTSECQKIEWEGGMKSAGGAA